LPAPVQDDKPIIFAETASEASQIAKRLQSMPLLDQWPRDYTAFRLDGPDIVFFAAGKPDLRLSNAL
jgi:hypothetical protein